MDRRIHARGCNMCFRTPGLQIHSGLSYSTGNCTLMMPPMLTPERKKRVASCTLLALALNACASASSTPTMQAFDPTRGMTKGFEHPDCVAARERARTTTFTVADTAFYRFPQPTNVIMPPMPAPPQLENFDVNIGFRVDSVGQVIVSKTRFSPIGYGYDSKFKSTMVKAKFRPAVLDGCAVEGSYDLVMTLNVTRSGQRRGGD